MKLYRRIKAALLIRDFNRAVKRGDSCQQLYAARNRAKAYASDDQQRTMNETLRSIGCYMADSVRRR